MGDDCTSCASGVFVQCASEESVPASVPEGKLHHAMQVEGQDHAALVQFGVGCTKNMQLTTTTTTTTRS